MDLIPLNQADLERFEKICGRLEALSTLLGLSPNTREIAAVQILLDGIEEEATAFCEELQERLEQAHQEP